MSRTTTTARGDVLTEDVLDFDLDDSDAVTPAGGDDLDLGELASQAALVEIDENEIVQATGRSGTDWDAWNRTQIRSLRALEADVARMLATPEAAMTRAERFEYVKALRALDDLKWLIMRENMGLVRSYTSRFTSTSNPVDTEDYHAAGQLGLMKAIATYDPDRDETSRARFSSWAHMLVVREVHQAVRSAEYNHMQPGDFDKRPKVQKASAYMEVQCEERGISDLAALLFAAVGGDVKSRQLLATILVGYYEDRPDAADRTATVLRQVTEAAARMRKPRVATDRAAKGSARAKKPVVQSAGGQPGQESPESVRVSGDTMIYTLLACMTGTALKTVQRVLDSHRHDSIFAPVGGEREPGTTTLADLIPDETDVPGEVFAALSRRAFASVALKVLTERERLVVIRRTGLDGEPVENLDNLGQKLGLSRESVRQIEYKAYAKLSHPAVLAHLLNLDEHVDAA